MDNEHSEQVLLLFNMSFWLKTAIAQNKQQLNVLKNTHSITVVCTSSVSVRIIRFRPKYILLAMQKVFKF